MKWIERTESAENMWSSMLEAAKMNPFGTPFVTAKCQAQDDVQGLIKGRNIAAYSTDQLGGKSHHNFYHIIIIFNKKKKNKR